MNDSGHTFTVDPHPIGDDGDDENPQMACRVTKLLHYVNVTYRPFFSGVDNHCRVFQKVICTKENTEILSGSK